MRRADVLVRAQTGVSENSKAKRRRRDPTAAGSSARLPTDFAVGRSVVDGTAAMMGQDLPPGVRNPLAPVTGTVLAVEEARHGMLGYFNFAAAAFEDRTLETILRSGASSRLTPSSTPEAQALRAHCLAVVYLLDAMQENYRRWQMRPATPAPVDAAAAVVVATMESGTAVTTATTAQTAGADSTAGLLPVADPRVPRRLDLPAAPRRRHLHQLCQPQLCHLPDPPLTHNPSRALDINGERVPRDLYVHRPIIWRCQGG
eukprot:COSAG02_NODE_6927_length_3284_cov_1.104553_4_plen_259_part_00